MRYINKNDRRIVVQEETCTCGHSAEEHEEHEGACQGQDDVSGKPCECTRYELDEASQVIPEL